MKRNTFMDLDRLIAQAVEILVDKLGAVEASRFLSLPRERRMESLQRHHRWQAMLDERFFFDEVFAPDTSASGGQVDQE